MASGDLREAIDGAVEVARDQVDGVAQLKRERGVEGVLLAGAKPDHAGGFGVAPGNLGRERADQRGHNAARCIGCKHGRVVALCACRLRDLVGGKSRNHADRGLRAC